MEPSRDDTGSTRWQLRSRRAVAAGRLWRVLSRCLYLLAQGLVTLFGVSVLVALFLALCRWHRPPLPKSLAAPAVSPRDRQTGDHGRMPSGANRAPSAKMPRPS